MTLIEEIREIRDRANRLIQDYRYSLLRSVDACLAVLANDEGREWRDAGYVHRELQRGGRHLDWKYVAKLLRDLEGDGRLECRSAPTGRQGPDQKQYRFPRELKSGASK